MVGVVDVDDVPEHTVGTAEQIVSQFAVVPPAQRRPAALVARYPDVVDEQVHQ